MQTPVLNISLGKHYIVECYDCSVEILNDAAALESILIDAACRAGATVIDSTFRTFEPQGVSGVVVIAESHLTVHTWPEHRYAAVDIFTCGSSIDFDTALQIIEQDFQCGRLVVSGNLDRGVLDSEGTLTVAEPARNQMRGSIQAWKAKFDSENGWGLLTSLDIHDCDPQVIRDGEAIKRFAVELCDHIEMRRFGDAVVVDFGEDERVAGFSLVQLIETSLVSGHFANLTNNAYIDIFSCKYYEPHAAADFCMRFFKGRNYTMNVVVRR